MIEILMSSNEFYKEIIIESGGMVEKTFKAIPN